MCYYVVWMHLIVATCSLPAVNKLWKCHNCFKLWSLIKLCTNSQSCNFCIKSNIILFYSPFGNFATLEIYMIVTKHKVGSMWSWEIVEK